MLIFIISHVHGSKEYVSCCINFDARVKEFGALSSGCP